MAKKDRVLKRAFEQSLENRRFEITLYWKRTKYFFTIFSTLGGLSVLIALLAKVLEIPTPLLFLALLIVECVGLVAAIAWVKVNLGSKYWQVNWETYVNKLGEDFIGPLFQYNIPEVGGLKRYSVSKVNLRLSYYIVAVWALILLTTIGHLDMYLMLSVPKYGSMSMLSLYYMSLYFGRGDYATYNLCCHLLSLPC